MTVTKSVAALKKVKCYVVTSAQTIIVTEAGRTAWIDSTTVSLAIPIRASSPTYHLLYHHTRYDGIQCHLWGYKRRFDWRVLPFTTLRRNTDTEWMRKSTCYGMQMSIMKVIGESFEKWYLFTKELTLILLNFISNQGCVYFLAVP